MDSCYLVQSLRIDVMRGTNISGRAYGNTSKGRDVTPVRVASSLISDCIVLEVWCCSMGLHSIDLLVELVNDKSCLILLILPKVPSKVAGLGRDCLRAA